MADSKDVPDAKEKASGNAGDKNVPKDINPRSAVAGSKTGESAGGDPSPATPEDAVRTRETQYLIAPRIYAGGIRPMSADLIATALNNLPDVNVVRRIKPSGVGALSVNDPTSTGEVIVARTSPERGLELEMAARQGAHVIVERDQLLNHHGLAPATQAAPGSLPGIFSRGQLDIQVRVLGDQGRPLAKAEVTIYGRNFPAQAQTDQNGSATVSLSGETPDSIRAMYVKPAVDHWERFIDRPRLDVQNVNTITVQPLSTTFSNFPSQQMVGWGQALMGLDKIPANLNGASVKVGIIDSGCDNTHPLLQHIRNGVDITNPDDPSTWTKDEISHGSHCAGVIAGAAAQGIRGFAPAAEVHIFKLFPGGRFSNLIDALDLCIERQVDVVNCSLGSDQVSEIVQRKLEEARQKGVAVVVAAGNSSGPVQFPATLPGVLSVSAIGQESRFPPDTYHAQTMLPGQVGVNGIFATKFSCFGPQVKVCGPGVAIVSSVPGGYAAWDGTSMAAPHLTGMAALVLAHHPAFQGPYKAHTAQRVDALFQMVISAATPVLADPLRGGAGLPDLTRVFGVQQPVAIQQPAFAAAPATVAQIAPALGAGVGTLAGVPLGPQVGAMLGQLLAGLAGNPPFMVGGGPVYAPGMPAPNGPYFPGAPAFVSPEVLMQLRSLGLA